MKKLHATLSLCIMSFMLFFLGCNMPTVNKKQQAAEALLRRLLPYKAGSFKVEIIPPANGRDVFEIEGRDGKIVLRGNNPVAIASALNWYLKYYAHCQVSWNSDNLRLQEVLPKVPKKVRLETAYAYRAYLNYCTFSYTMPWWDWKRWEREIDWMAMHGINMPLAVTGQEAVWQNTLSKFRMNEKEIKGFLVGPAFSAWQFMGNIEGWGGPLPQRWIDSHVKLGKQILQRERELGMTPILQGFTGCVPKIMKEKFPGAGIAVKGDWYGVPPGSSQLDPLDPLFAEMGRVFLEEQTRLFGTDHLYAADPFHEGEPPVKGDGYMKKVGTAIYKVTSSVDPKAVIVMQTWSLREQIAKSIPLDRIIFLDLTGGNAKKFNGFWGRPWIAGILHNYGGRVFMGGDLEYYGSNAARLRKDPAAGNLLGIGLFPEAIGQNPVVYDLGSEIAWHQDAPELSAWIRDYTYARYGKLSPPAVQAWKILLQTVYGNGLAEPSMESVICARPSLEVKMAAPNGDLTRVYDPARLWEAWKLLLQAKDVQGMQTFQYDLVDVARQCLADLSLDLQKEITRAYLKKDKAALKLASQRFLELADDLDGLLATRNEFLLGKWIKDARRWGNTEKERDYYENNARRLVTSWGPVHDDALLFDYSNRQWAGLIKGYYKVRWIKFLDFLAQQPDGAGRFTQQGLKMAYDRPAYDANAFYKELAAFEENWVTGNERYADLPAGDPIKLSEKLYRKWNETKLN